MRFEQIYYFVKIADLHSFSAASEHLFVSQQALSTSIKNLEKDFHTTLFIRTPRGVTLSDDGRYFYDIARKMLSLYEELHCHFLITPENQAIIEPLNITLNSTIKNFFFTKSISYFYKKFPSYTVNYIIKDNHDIIDTLLNKEADLGVLPVLKLDADLQTTIPDTLHFIPFHESRFSLITNINSPLARFKSVSMSTVVKHPIIINNNSMIDERLLQKALELTNEPANIINADSNELLRQFVQDNIGNAIVPDIDSSPLPDCIKIPITDNMIISIGFLHDNTPLTKLQTLFIDKAINFIEKDI